MKTLHFLEQKGILDEIPMGIVILDPFECIIEINQYACEVLQCRKEEVIRRLWSNKFPSVCPPDSSPGNEGQSFVNFKCGNENYVLKKHPFYGKGKQAGFVLLFQKTTELEQLTQALDSYRDMSRDLQAIFDISYDVIYVSDGNGITLRVSSACEKLWGHKESELVGKSVNDLERLGLFKPSVTRLVLEKKEKVSMIQTTKTGRRLMVVGTPIKDEQGRIVRVVNASRDITEVSKLQLELDELRSMTEGYKKELMELRQKDEEQTNIIYRSVKMREVVGIAQKVAQVDATVLLTGESGVGKDVLASFIHKWGPRSKKPFVTFNCASIPEKLLEAELFGSEEDISGDGDSGKRIGLFEMAHEGTLYLDEICSLPPTLQTKLLKVLEDMEVVRIGSTTRLKVDVRIIASTNRNLEEEIASGAFRSDLYYRLNVIPIAIPPLRERKEDILALSLHFIHRLTEKYGLNKKFSSSIMEKFQHYHWPGNVRELRNTIENVLLTTNHPVITAQDLPKHMAEPSGTPAKIQVNDIVPLKEAVETVESELLEMALQKYGSTTKMAEVLGVNQSTISRKLQAMNRRKADSGR